MARPKKPEDERHDLTFRVRLTREQGRCVRRLARELDIEPGQVLRIMVVAEMKRRREEAQLKDCQAA